MITVVLCARTSTGEKIPGDKKAFYSIDSQGIEKFCQRTLTQKIRHPNARAECLDRFFSYEQDGRVIEVE